MAQSIRIAVTSVLLSLLFILAAPASVAYAFLPPSDVTSFEAQAANTHTPQIFVSDFNIGSRTAYKAGEVINGTFVLYNHSDFPVPGVTYTLTAMGGLAANTIRVYDELKGTAPISLSAKEKKVISFAYTIPSRFNGEDLNLMVESRTADGLEAGWQASAFFDVTGGAAQLDVVKSSVEVRGGDKVEFYQTGAAVTIYKDKYPSEAFAQFVLTNNAKETLGVVPVIDIASLQKPTENLYHEEHRDSLVTVSSGAQSESVSVALPNFDWKAGVYEGNVTFKDLQGIERADRIHFKYIVGGEIYSVYSLYSNVESVRKGADLTLYMKISGSPFDMYSGEHPLTQIASVHITLFNEKDKKIADLTENVDFLNNPVRNFVVKAERDAEAIRAHVEVKKGENNLGEYDFNISSDYDEVHEKAKGSFFGNVWGIVVGAVILIAVAACVYPIYKRRKAYKEKR